MKRNQVPKIAIDLMGSETSCEPLIKAVLELKNKNLITSSFILIGTNEVKNRFDKHFSNEQYKDIEFLESKTSISMEEDPLLAVRRKKDSSMAVGMRLLNDKKADAFISTGNTGALMTSAKMYLSLLPTISRPSLLALFPTKKHLIAVLDVGANISNESQYLIQSAVMGIAFKHAIEEKKPKIALLNIGTEEIKGTNEIKKAFYEIKNIEKDKSDIFEFTGNIEGKDIFDGNIDVLVTDGFTGNVFLKTSEGIASYILDNLHENISEKEFSHIKPILKDLQKHLHYSEYPGALLCGTDGIVIKCHGYSNPHAIMNAIIGVEEFCKKNLIDSMKRFLEKHFIK